MSADEKKYDLEERTFVFSKLFLTTVNQLPRTFINSNLISQSLRSSTSIGANYREACEAESKKERIYRISICKKEAKETLYWVQLLKEFNHPKLEDLNKLEQEVTELMKIFGKIAEKLKS